MFSRCCFVFRHKTASVVRNNKCSFCKTHHVLLERSFCDDKQKRFFFYSFLPFAMKLIGEEQNRSRVHLNHPFSPSLSLSLSLSQTHTSACTRTHTHSNTQTHAHSNRHTRTHSERNAISLKRPLHFPIKIIRWVFIHPTSTWRKII